MWTFSQRNQSNRNKSVRSAQKNVMNLQNKILSKMGLMSNLIGRNIFESSKRNSIRSKWAPLVVLKITGRTTISMFLETIGISDHHRSTKKNKMFALAKMLRQIVTWKELTHKTSKKRIKGTSWMRKGRTSFLWNQKEFDWYFYCISAFFVNSHSDIFSFPHFLFSRFLFSDLNLDL